MVVIEDKDVLGKPFLGDDKSLCHEQGEMKTKLRGVMMAKKALTSIPGKVAYWGEERFQMLGRPTFPMRAVRWT